MDAPPTSAMPHRAPAAPSGRLTCVFNTRAAVPKYHLDPQCSGLDSVAPACRATRRFSSLAALARTAEGRPCRRCALEASLVALSQGAWVHARHGAQFVTFSGQGCPDESGWAPQPYDFTDVSDSGAARLVRLAALLHLDVTDTVVGPVAHGRVPPRWCDVLGRNLRCYRLDTPAADPVTVSTFWALLTRDPPERGAVLDVDAVWSVAAAIAA